MERNKNTWGALSILATVVGVSLVLMASGPTCKTWLDQEGSYQNYPIEPVDIRNVKLTDNFWLPVIETVQQKTLEYALEKCREEGRFENFLLAGGKLKGEVRGVMPFDDSDVYKIIEGASNSLISSPDPQLEMLLDSLIAIVKTGQERDGYLTTWRTINPAKPPAPWVAVVEGERWESLGASHELYNAGHMYEAAAVHYLATGKRNFLDIAAKNADLIVNTFGRGKLESVPGHQIIETGLISLYRITGKEEYLKLARYFLDQRGVPGTRELYGPYSQDHLPVTRQNEVVGHAVRAVYMYAAMTDVAAIYGDSAYLQAVKNLWENMVNEKMYITGGLGARHEGESFGAGYELPNKTAYSETCAAIGSVYWNQRLFKLFGQSQYYDIIERTLYNGLIAGLSKDGTHFFYPNPLESDGVYTFNQGACTRKSWFDCSCCPTNLIRFLPAVPGLIYAKNADTLYVNLYASNEAEIDLNGKKVTVKQETQYPWEGQVSVAIDPEENSGFTLKLRIPGWVRSEAVPGDLYRYREEEAQDYLVSVNGFPFKEMRNGYVSITRKWKKGDVVTLNFPMTVRQVTANEKVEADRGLVALEYGPVVYAFEEVDNQGHFDRLSVKTESTFKVRKSKLQQDELLMIDLVNGQQEYSAVPYYAWSNRGVGKMKVWIPDSTQPQIEE